MMRETIVRVGERENSKVQVEDDGLMGLRTINPIDVFARRVTTTMAVTVTDIWINHL
jgi:hypothetical protein